MKKYSGSNMFFIVGSPRSGTTWLQLLLSKHPRIRSGLESYLFTKICDIRKEWHLHKDQGLGMACFQTEAEFECNLETFCESQLDALTKGLEPDQLFMEKTPSHALYIPEILHFLPQTRFIHMLRDGRDVVASLLGANSTWGQDWAPKHARRAARTWKNHVETVLKSRAALKPAQFMEVRYETLSENTPQELRRCAEFLGLVWTDAEIAAAVEAYRADKMRAGQGTQLPLGGEVAKKGILPFYLSKGFVRKARAGSWREDLTFKQRYHVWRVLRKTMKKYGYEWPAFFL